MAQWPESVCVRLQHRESQPSIAESRSVHRAIVDPIMGDALQPRRSDPIISLAGVLGCLVIIFSNVGCATIKGEKYTFENLPKQYIAGVRDNPQTIDLTRLASATASTEVLDKGDVVELSILASLSDKDIIKMPLRIQEDGCADVPEIGRVQLAGLQVTAAEAMIVSEFIQRGIYHNPNVTLLMKSRRMNRIMVAGAVKKPSIYELPRGQCDLLAALSKAEGLDASAGTQVIIRNLGGNSRGKPSAVAGGSENGIESVGHTVETTSGMSDTIKVDLISATKNGTGGYQLQDGAVVYVERRDPEPLHVLGLVAKSGRYEFPIAEDIRVTDAVAMAGGVTSQGADKIFVIRRKPLEPGEVVDPEHPDKLQTFIIQVSLANCKQKAESNIRLAPGDVVSVETTALSVITDRILKTGFNIGASVPLLGY